jgi:hypothetical protein
MILFINVFISDHRRFGIHYNRYGLPGNNRLDIFKYSLASLAALNPLWSWVVIYCELGPNYFDRWFELEAFIGGLFEKKKYVLYKNRCCTQKQWQEAYRRDLEPRSDWLIWYQGNDDHVFLDYKLDQIENITQAMYKDQEEYISCMYSHWPEYVRFVMEGKGWREEHAAVYWSLNTDAIHIVSKPSFYRWWFHFDWGGGDNLVRSDFIKFSKKCPTKCYVPYRELVRHFDGYSHSMHLPDCCPPLHIPQGFFKSNIKILYGGTEKRPGWTHINPLLPYRTVMPNGADFRYALDEIPLFWKNRISTFEIIEDIPKGNAYRARNLEKLNILEPGRKFAGRSLPVMPINWAEHYLFRKPDEPKLL